MNYKNVIFCLLFFVCKIVQAQPKKAIKDDGKMATVNVVMTNSKNIPQKGEQVIFVSTLSGKSFMVKTDTKGKASLRLPPDDDYTMKLKSLQDTTKYSTMKIPALQEDQLFTAPFIVTIQYDPPVSFTLNNVQFDVGQATLRPASYKQLDELADYMQWKEVASVEIAGHTDNVGKAADNLKLSQRRAETVKAYLVKKGIAAAKITAKGYGDSQPITDNSTAAGRQQNRRTEARLTEGL